jgi:Ser/Thr protein kinase RdoA (MazF antagonist)
MPGSGSPAAARRVTADPQNQGALHGRLRSSWSVSEFLLRALGSDGYEGGFAREVCGIFGLAADGLTITSLPGSTNRLWRLQTPSGRFVVKEFPYEGAGEGLLRAAEFEHDIWSTGRLAMPEPVRATDGRLIHRLAGSRGSTVLVRVHRYLDGTAITLPPSTGTACAAGVALATIQRFGLMRETRPSGSLRWWTITPETILTRLQDAEMLEQDQVEMAQAALRGAEAVIAAGEELPGRWVFTHCDHKPENSLLTDGRVAVLDWDEAGCCHPRLEAVESALRWAGVGHRKPRPDVFRAFLTGYQRHAGQLRPLQRADFAKWVAALAGWFSFTGRRALRDFDDTDAEASDAASMAIESIGTLRDTLASLDHWAEWLAAP